MNILDEILWAHIIPKMGQLAIIWRRLGHKGLLLFEKAKKYLTLKLYGDIIGKNILWLTGIYGIDLSTCTSFTIIALNIIGAKSVNLANIQACDSTFGQLNGILEIIAPDCSRVTDNGINCLRGVRNVSLSNCKWGTDEALRAFEEAKVVKLAYWKLLNGYGLRYLTHATEVHLHNCGALIGTNLQYLAKVPTVCLQECHAITDEDLKWLKEARDINLAECSKITDTGLQYLQGVKSINISCCNMITNEGLRHIKGVNAAIMKSIGISWGLKYLTNIQVINLYGCVNVKDEHLVYLERAVDVTLGLCNVTKEGIGALRSVKRLTLITCHLITANGLRDCLIGQLERLVIIDCELVGQEIKKYCEEANVTLEYRYWAK
jgi:hypothetical protein